LVSFPALGIDRENELVLGHRKRKEKRKRTGKVNAQEGKLSREPQEFLRGLDRKGGKGAKRYNCGSGPKGETIGKKGARGLRLGTGEKGGIIVETTAKSVKEGGGTGVTEDTREKNTHVLIRNSIGQREGEKGGSKILNIRARYQQGGRRRGSGETREHTSG